LPDGIVSNKKFPIWVNFGGSCNWRCWYILWPFWSILLPFGSILLPFGIFCCHLEILMAIWYIFPRFCRGIVPIKSGNPALHKLLRQAAYLPTNKLALLLSEASIL
jgi:hypothetical protein